MSGLQEAAGAGDPDDDAGDSDRAPGRGRDSGLGAPVTRRTLSYGALDSAILTAVGAHAGQVDKAGAPYILHPLRVMLALQRYGETAMIVGVLHDVVEDTAVTLDMVRQWYGDAVADAVDIVTKRADEEGGVDAYRRFVHRIAASGNVLAMRVKVADLTDNMDLGRLGREPTEGDRRRVTKYVIARAVLTWAIAEVGRLPVGRLRDGLVADTLDVERLRALLGELVPALPWTLEGPWDLFTSERGPRIVVEILNSLPALLDAAEERDRRLRDVLVKQEGWCCAIDGETVLRWMEQGGPDPWQCEIAKLRAQLEAADEREKRGTMMQRPREICPKCDQRMGINHADGCRENVIRQYERERDQRLSRRQPPPFDGLHDELVRLRRLAWGVVHNAHRIHLGGTTVAGMVADRCGIGSTQARDLCREHGVDPDAEIPRVQTEAADA